MFSVFMASFFTFIGLPLSELSAIQRFCRARVIATYNILSFSNDEHAKLHSRGLWTVPHDKHHCDDCRRNEGPFELQETNRTYR